MGDARYQVEAAQADDERSAEKLVAAYRAGCASLRAAYAGLGPEELTARPVRGKMSALEVLSHLADTEQFLADRMKRTIGTELPLLIGIDATPYLERLHYQQRDPELQMRLIEVTREQMAADLDRVPAEDWLRHAIHTETGMVSLRQLLLHTIRHLDWHLATVWQKREALGISTVS